MQGSPDHLHSKNGPTSSHDDSIRLASLLGSGRHGMVFLGSQSTRNGDRDVAVKVPSSPGGLFKERSALSRFEHPNIVHQLGEPLSNGSLVLEHCDLGSLMSRVVDRPLSATEVCDLLTAIAAALHRVHSEGWIHGDVSPGNVGLRSTGGPALLDFATARPADGSLIDEGTAEFAGPLRHADPRLDIRCLASTALFALGEPDRWDQHKNRLRSELNGLISRCDALAPVDLADLTSLATRTGGTCDTMGSTRTFGPRPDDRALDEAVPEARAGSTWPLVAMLVVTIALIAGEFLGTGSAPPGSPPAQLSSQRTAAESLDRADAQWDSTTAVLVRRAFENDAPKIGVGEPGDVAAIADWSCDGLETIGIYRPSTGGWFEFDSWKLESLSAEPATLEKESRLFVLTDLHGCAQPLLR